MADASAAKSVTAEGSPAAWVISPATSTGKSSTTPCERLGSGRERYDDYYDCGPGGRSIACQMN